MYFCLELINLYLGRFGIIQVSLVEKGKRFPRVFLKTSLIRRLVWKMFSLKKQTCNTIRSKWQRGTFVGRHLVHIERLSRWKREKTVAQSI